MLATTIADLLNLVRNELSDVLADPTEHTEDEDVLWKTSELLTYATEAADAVARATYTLHEVVTLNVVAGTRTITLPQRILNIRYAWLVTARRNLSPGNANESNAHELFSSTGTPYEYVADYTPNSIVLYPTPIAADTLQLQCSVTLAAALTLNDQMPLAETPDQRLMITYMKHLAYQKHDAETYDLERSMAYLASFNNDAPLRRAEKSNQRRRPGTVRINW